jgi:hypothetical protein
MPNPPLAVWIPILMNVVALLQCVLAAKNAKVAKELGGVYTLSARGRIVNCKSGESIF